MVREVLMHVLIILKIAKQEKEMRLDYMVHFKRTASKKCYAVPVSHF
jgi:hypothetical protein